MIIKWLTDTRGAAIIDRIECTRETARAVWYTVRDDFEKPAKEVKSPKVSRCVIFHDTWQDAHDYLNQHALERVMGARRQLEVASSYAGNVKGMRAPVEAPT